MSRKLLVLERTEALTIEIQGSKRIEVLPFGGVPLHPTCW